MQLIHFQGENNQFLLRRSVLEQRNMMMECRNEGIFQLCQIFDFRIPGI